MTTLEAFPPAPDHPQAPLIEAQLYLLRGVLECWVWEVHEGGDLSVVLKLRDEAMTLRVWVSGDRVELDVAATQVPLDVRSLTWVLLENRDAYKARATSPENGLVPIYLSAQFGTALLAHLARSVWEGFTFALYWRGMLRQMVFPAHVRAISA